MGRYQSGSCSIGSGWEKANSEFELELAMPRTIHEGHWPQQQEIGSFPRNELSPECTVRM